MPNCVISNCETRSRNYRKEYHLFKVKKNDLELWQKALERNDLTTKHFICNKRIQKEEYSNYNYLYGPDKITVLGVVSFYYNYSLILAFFLLFNTFNLLSIRKKSYLWNLLLTGVNFQVYNN